MSSHNGFNITCKDANDGSIDVTVGGGTSAYTYAWTTADGSGLDATAEDQTGLGPGTYLLDVTDSNSCPITTQTYVITEPPGISVSETLSSHNGFNITCKDANDGSIDLTVTGGIITGDDYTYSWTTTDGSGLDPATKNQSGLGPGTYKVIISDSNSCPITKNYLITEP